MYNCGVKKPIYVLPNSVDLDIFKKEGIKLQIDGLKGLNFVSMFHFGSRKAPEVLVKAFCKAFSSNDDVTLTIHSLSMKHNLEQSGTNIGNWINSLTDKTYDKPTILVTANFMEDSMIPCFLRNFDVFVLPTRSEGFGLPVIEAGAIGIPSIVTGYSGVLDIVDNDNGWLIDYELKDIPLQYLPYFQNYIGGQWAEPNEEHLISIFRHIYEHRDEIKTKGKLAFEKSQNYGINNIGRIARSVIFDE
jgi:glycosyltransferase involved in cell wall biosynthesis